MASPITFSKGEKNGGISQHRIEALPLGKVLVDVVASLAFTSTPSILGMASLLSSYFFLVEG
ncbi:hypothetical protein AMTR_s00044p00213580 [Amborella trichopoda]|uniref:Uncharacterized protein n=1 Tax=Amborella trichopoda TaxID=13333 RepID=U5DA39_AMBTC|nr:hypothetical protein AMTR_s00044p00213580 [Amborella trichopoda]